MTTTDTPQDRRNYFRVDQDAIFEFRTVDVHSAESEDPVTMFSDDSSMQLITALRRADRDAQQTLNILSEKHRLLGDYLQRLNNKIDLIARHSMFTATQGNQSHKVNLSEGGIAFECNRAHYKGNFLVLRLIFLPSYTPVVTFAKITRCQSDGDSHKIAAKFHKLSDNDRKILAREVLKAQVSHRKRATKQENTGQ